MGNGALPSWLAFLRSVGLALPLRLSIAAAEGVLSCLSLKWGLEEREAVFPNSRPLKYTLEPRLGARPFL